MDDTKKKNYYYKLGGGTRALHVSAPLPHQPAPILINLRGLVFNFVKKKFLRLSLFVVADFFSRTKTFIDIEDDLVFLVL
jgi:hypothetical protein